MVADPRVAALLEPGTRRLVRTVDAMQDADWAGPSGLPGWTRAHVVAHLTLNAEGLAGALQGVHEGQRVPMYRSGDARNDDIEALAGRPPGEIRDRFLASTTVVDEWIEDLADNLEATPIDRVPGGRVFAAGDVGRMRVCEVHLHHVDLDRGFTSADWSTDFVTLLLDARSAAYVGEPGFTVTASDLGRSWSFGAGGPTVSGPGAALAWWATGRGSGEGLTSDNGTLPRIEAW